MGTDPAGGGVLAFPEDLTPRMRQRKTTTQETPRQPRRGSRTSPKFPMSSDSFSTYSLGRGDSVTDGQPPLPSNKFPRLRAHPGHTLLCHEVPAATLCDMGATSGAQPWPAQPPPPAAAPGEPDTVHCSVAFPRPFKGSWRPHPWFGWSSQSLHEEIFLSLVGLSPGPCLHVSPFRNAFSSSCQVSPPPGSHQ